MVDLLRRSLLFVLLLSITTASFAGCGQNDVGGGDDLGGRDGAAETDSGDAGPDSADGAPGTDASEEGELHGEDLEATCDVTDDCPSFPQSEAVCIDDGECRWRCENGFQNADDSIEPNGCECDDSGTEVCDQKDNDCDGMVDEHVDKMTDLMNCGGCGNMCEVPNAAAACVEGSCGVGSCDEGWADCDGDAMNGCEADTTGDVDHCGGCGQTCTTTNTTSVECREASCHIEGCEEGWKSCDGDPSTGCEQDVADSLDHCGGCGETCSFPNAQADCEAGECQFVECKDGYHDLNDDRDDGCEYACKKTSQTDAPDPQGEDENCDGIDGVLDRAVFVAPSADGGDDSNDGRSRDTPLETIQQGIQVAHNCSPTCIVLVAGGTYAESIALKSGIPIVGGYSATDWSRDPSSHVTVIEGQDRRTVLADALTSDTLLQGLTIEGASFNSGGQSTYAVWAKDLDSTKLALQNVEIRAGDGGAGMDGSDGPPGSGGGDAAPSSNTSGGAGGSSSCGAVGGAGGDGTETCTRVNGGDGEAGGDPVIDGDGGRGGNPDCGGCTDSGGDANPGIDGGAGSGGSGGTKATDTDGSFTGRGFWTGATAGAGGEGDNGTGGGGGGAGGVDEDPFHCGNETEAGGGGGGGGAGGCGATGGQPGRPGGGSFGVVAIDSTVLLFSSDIVRGDGGDGGAGGDGGDGGTGGAGSSGSSGVGEAGDGAAGGDGGAGGGGGGGAGGCGGPSIGIAEVGSTSVTTSNISVTGGTPGDGGTGGSGGLQGGSGSTADAGEAGCTGAHAEKQSY